MQGGVPEDAVDGAAQGHLQEGLRHLLDIDVGRFEVVRRQRSRRGAQLQRLQQGVEAEIFTVLVKVAAPCLEIDDDLAGPLPLGATQRQVVLAVELDAVVAQLHAAT